MMCQAKARVSLMDEKWILKSLDGSHRCEPNEPKVLAEFLRHTMKNLVRQNPTLPVREAIRKVKIEAAKQYSDNEELYCKIIAELGTESALDKQMYRVRTEIDGPTPKSRNDFDAKEFLSKVFNDESQTICMDSNNLNSNWRKNIDNKNHESEYSWEKYTDEEIIRMDQEHNQEEGEDEVEVEEDSDDPMTKDLPKRVYAFT